MAAKYQILRMDTLGTPPILNGGLPYVFDNPQEAAIVAKELSKRMMEKLCVKAVVDDAWRRRELARFASAEYRHLPWATSGWWASDAAYAIHKDHYAHASLEKPGWIAYTKSEEDGAKDKQSLLRPGAYLNRYFEKVLYDHGMSEQGLVEIFMKMYGPIDIKFAVTEEDITKAYDHGPHTCMNDKEWPKNIHPATIYAAGDLQVAYIGDLNKKVSARTLVWPDKKIHSRIYGDIARMTQGLTRLGYKWGAPLGAKVKRVELHKVEFDGYDPPSGCFLAPYIDKKNQQGGGHLGLIDKGDHLVICLDGERGSHHAGMADGRTGHYMPREDERPTFTCDRCEEEVENVGVVYDEIDDDGDCARMSWCQDCMGEYSEQCTYSGNYYTENVAMVQVDGLPWAERYAKMYAVKCEATGKFCHPRNAKTVFFPDGSKKVLSNAYTQEQGGLFQSGLTGRLWFKDERVRYYDANYDRFHAAKIELSRHTFQCDGCDDHWVISTRIQCFSDDRLYCPICTDKINEPRLGEEAIPVSKSRKAFEKERQKQQRLIAAE